MFNSYRLLSLSCLNQSVVHLIQPFSSNIKHKPKGPPPPTTYTLLVPDGPLQSLTVSAGLKALCGFLCIICLLNAQACWQHSLNLRSWCQADAINLCPGGSRFVTDSSSHWSSVDTQRQGAADLVKAVQRLWTALSYGLSKLQIIFMTAS